MILSRRKFILGAAAVVAAPAVIRIPGLIMPVKAVVGDNYLNILMINNLPTDAYWTIIDANGETLEGVYDQLKGILRTNYDGPVTIAIRAPEKCSTFLSLPCLRNGETALHPIFIDDKSI